MKQKERAAMQAAWVWMDWYSSNNGTLEPVDFNETITALREALAEQEKPLYRKVLREMLDAHEQAEQAPVFSSKCPKCNHKVIGTHIGEVWWCPKCQHEWPFEQAEQEPIRLQCTTCGTVYADGVPPQVEQAEQNPLCKQHPDAPHGFDRNASHNADRYVCECESWSPDDTAHRPGGLSMEQEPNSLFMESYRIGLAEMREACALRAEAYAYMSDNFNELAREIRAIKFEGDTGFCPVSEMIAEQLDLEAIGKEQLLRYEEKFGAIPQPVSQDFETWWEQEGQEFLYALNTTTDDDIKLVAEFAWKNGAYKAENPVKEVELTDDEIVKACGWEFGQPMYEWVIGLARVVIAADREKNK